MCHSFLPQVPAVRAVSDRKGIFVGCRNSEKLPSSEAVHDVSGTRFCLSYFEAIDVAVSKRSIVDEAAP